LPPHRLPATPSSRQRLTRPLDTPPPPTGRVWEARLLDRRLKRGDPPCSPALHPFDAARCARERYSSSSPGRSPRAIRNRPPNLRRRILPRRRESKPSNPPKSTERRPTD